MLRCLATIGMPRWRGRHDLKLARLCWSPPSSPQATGSASIPRMGNIWNECQMPHDWKQGIPGHEFEGLCFNTTRRREERSGDPKESPDLSHANILRPPSSTNPFLFNTK